MKLLNLAVLVYTFILAVETKEALIIRKSRVNVSSPLCAPEARVYRLWYQCLLLQQQQMFKRKPKGA